MSAEGRGTKRVEVIIANKRDAKVLTFRARALS
jgi:hypothetical protein